MKIFKIIFLCIIITLLNCNNNQNKINNKESKLQYNNGILNSKSIKKYYYFYPYKYVLHGFISTYEEFGPPNYGETPDIDRKEQMYYITIDSLVSIIPVDSFDERVDNIKRFQIVGYSYKQMDSLIGEKIFLKGSFFNATTGHHHTDAIFDICTSIGVMGNVSN